MPKFECIENENIILMITDRGSHVAWISGIFSMKPWFPKPVMEFIKNIAIE